MSTGVIGCVDFDGKGEVAGVISGEIVDVKSLLVFERGSLLLDDGVELAVGTNKRMLSSIIRAGEYDVVLRCVGLILMDN